MPITCLFTYCVHNLSFLRYRDSSLYIYNIYTYNAFANLISLNSCYIIIKRNTMSGTAILRMKEEENNANSSTVKEVIGVPVTMTRNVKHNLHSSIFHPLLREWQSMNSNNFTACNLMLPIFVSDMEHIEHIESMFGVCRFGVSLLISHLTPLIKRGLKSILLFGVLRHLSKDAIGSHADSEENPVIKAVKILRSNFPDLVIACDVCLCPYTSHGHCGIVREDGSIDNEASIKRIAEVALAYAAAGAHIVAPSDMMDSRVAAIKQALMMNNLSHKVAILSYSAKFASTLYGPFREASLSTPSTGDRQCYQLPSGSAGLAIRAAKRDVEEGADMLMVKPGLPYLDIVKRIKDAHPEYPLFVYQVSGEYAMLQNAANNKAFNLLKAVKETITCMRRAGADCIITYFTPILLDALYKQAKY